MDIQKKLEDYLNDDVEEDFLSDEDTDMMDRMIEFIMNLSTETLTEDQIDEATEIIDLVADDDMDEAFSAKKVKIKPSEKRERRMEYRRKRAQMKLKAKKFRRTTKYRRWSRMKKRRSTQGKTATGKRIRKFL